MQNKNRNMAKISLEHYGRVGTVEVPNEGTAYEYQEAFDRLLVLMGFSNDIRCNEGGHFELQYVDPDEEEKNELSPRRNPLRLERG